jgi:hypothetical protein
VVRSYDTLRRLAVMYSIQTIGLRAHAVRHLASLRNKKPHSGESVREFHYVLCNMTY